MNQYKEKNLVQYKKYKMCPVTYLRTLITPYGIYPCPYKRGYEKYNIGNIKENSFKNIWNYYKFENHCKEINACKDCNFFCIRDKLNQELLKLVKNPYLIDNIDARMAMMDKALETVEYGKFTKRVFSLENRALYKPKMYEK